VRRAITLPSPNSRNDPASHPLDAGFFISQLILAQAAGMNCSILDTICDVLACNL